MNRALITTLLLALLMALPCSGAGEAADEIAPLVNEQTLMVVVIDLDRLEMAGMSKWVVQQMGKAKAIDPAALEKVISQFNEQVLNELRAAVQQLRDAGAQRLFWVMHTNSRRVMPLVMAIPVTQATGRRVEALVAQDLAQRVVRMGDLVVAGSDRSVELVEHMQPARRDELAQALSAAGDAPLRVAVMQSAGFAQELQQEMRQAPPPLQSAIGALLQAKWAAATLEPPPRRASLGIMVQCQDGEAAQALAEQLKQFVAFLQQVPEFEKQGPWLLELLGRVQPKAENDRVLIAADEQMLEELVAALVPAVVAAREQAMIVASGSNMRQILVATHMYANENNGRLPNSLDDLKPYLGESAELVLSNPRRPKDGFAYVKPAETLRAVANPAETILLYETYDQWPGGINMGFADGHVEHWRDQQRVEEAIASLKDEKKLSD